MRLTTKSACGVQPTHGPRYVSARSGHCEIAMAPIVSPTTWDVWPGRKVTATLPLMMWSCVASLLT